MIVRVVARSKDEWWTAYMEDFVHARDSASTRFVVGEDGRVEAELPLTDDDAGGVAGFVARHWVAALLIGLGVLISTVLATVAVTQLAARRHHRSSTPAES
jgi:hypothetical protein